MPWKITVRGFARSAASALDGDLWEAPRRSYSSRLPGQARKPCGCTEVRQACRVSLTASGHKVLAEYATAVAALEQDMTAELDRSGVEAFRSYLGACRVALNRTAAR